MKRYAVEVRKKGEKFGEPGELIESIKVQLRSKSIGNFNPIYCTYKSKEHVVNSREGDLSDPFRRNDGYLKTLYIEVEVPR